MLVTNIFYEVSSLNKNHKYYSIIFKFFPSYHHKNFSDPSLQPSTCFTGLCKQQVNASLPCFGGVLVVGGITEMNNSTRQHLTVHQSYLISFCNKVTRPCRSVECCGNGVYLDFAKALNQIAHDILVDKMEKCAMNLLE